MTNFSYKPISGDILIPGIVKFNLWHLYFFFFSYFPKERLILIV